MATYKGIGFDNTNGKTRTGTSTDIVAFDTGLSVASDASFLGNLSVVGDIISRGAVDLVVQDNFIDLNFANSTTTAESGGLTIQMNRTSGFVGGTVTTFVAGVASTSNPTFTYTDDGSGNTNVLAAGDVVIIAGANESENDGIYVVSSVDGSSLPQVVTIKGVGTVARDASTPWAQTQFTADTGDTADAFKTDLFVQLVADGTTAFTDPDGNAFTKGTFLTSYQTAATESQFAADGGYSTVESTLQSAYNGGNSITTASSNDIQFDLSSGGFIVNGGGAVDFGNAGADLSGFSIGTGSFDVNATGAVTLDGTAASNFTVAGNSLTLATTTSGDIDITSAATLDIDAVAVELNSTGGLTAALSGGASSITSTSQNLTIATATSGDLDLTSAATLDIDAVAVELTATGGLIGELSGSASDITSTGQNFTLATATSGTLALTSAGTLDLDGVAVNIDSSGAMDITAADGQTLSVNHGGGSALAMNATGQIDLTSESGQALNIGSTQGNLALSTTTSGTLSLQSAGAFDIDAAAASDISVTGAQLTLQTVTSGLITISSVGTLNLLGDDNTTLKMDADIDAPKEIKIEANNPNAGASARGNITLDADDNVSIQGGSTGTIQANIGGSLKLSVSNAQSIFSNKLVIDSSAGLQVNGESTLIDTILDEDDMASDDVNGLATQRSIKAYVDSQAGLSFIELTTDGTGVAAGDVVAINSSGLATKADKASAQNVVGIAESTAGASTTVFVKTSGNQKGFSGLTAGQKLYLNTSGSVTATAPSSAGDVVFQIGYARSASEIIIVPQFIMEIG